MRATSQKGKRAGNPREKRIREGAYMSLGSTVGSLQVKQLQRAAAA